MGANGPATSADVARLAQVSRAVVSQIFNAKGDRFSDDTVARVRQAAETLKYRPSVAGRALARGHSDIVVVSVPNTTFGEDLQTMLDLLTEGLAAHGLSVIVRFTSRQSNLLRRTVETLRPFALLDLSGISSKDATLFEALGCRVLGSQFETTSSSASNVYGGMAALQVEYLANRGHYRLAYAALSDGRDDVYGRGRVAGVLSACMRLGLPDPTVVSVELQTEQAAKVIQELRASPPQVTGIVCYNDAVAIALIAGARSLGLTVPQDLALVGMDATSIGQLVAPRLSTVTVRYDLIASRTIASIVGPEAATDLFSGSDMFAILDGETA